MLNPEMVDDVLLDKAVRAYFEMFPMFAHSVSLAELCGVAVEDPIAFDVAIENGFDVSGTRTMIAAVIPTIQKHTIATMRDGLVDLLREQHEAMAEVMQLRRMSKDQDQRNKAQAAINVWRKVEAVLSSIDI